MSKWKCKTPNCGKPCYAELPEHHKPRNCVLDGRIPDWKEDDETTISSIKLPKLTAEVFDREDCPEWAKYAAVDKCGSVRLFSHSPWLGESCWNWANGEVTQLFGVTFDASDWQKSRIKRPEKKTLPEWCKVGAIGYYPGCGYFKIIEIISGNDNIEVLWLNLGKGGSVMRGGMAYNMEARLRPYSPDEMGSLVGKVLHHNTGSYLVTAFENRWNQVKIESVWRDADELMEVWTWLDGKPCGVLEHLKNGEWVE